MGGALTETFSKVSTFSMVKLAKSQGNVMENMHIFRNHNMYICIYGKIREFMKKEIVRFQSPRVHNRLIHFMLFNLIYINLQENTSCITARSPIIQ